MRQSTRMARWAATAACVLAAALALAGQAVAVPGVQDWIGDQPATPDIEETGLTLFDSSGGTITGNGTAGTLNFTLDGVPFVGYCTDTSRIFSTATEAVDLTTSEPPASPDDRAVAWILLNRTPVGPSTAEARRAAATSQVAIWLLTDPGINATQPTDDAALNAAALALVQEARTRTAAPASLSLAITPPAAGATTATVSVTGRPGAVVDLAASAGTLSAARVVLDGAGNGSVTLTVAGPGSASVQATTAGDGRLITIEPTNPERRPQPTVAASPTALTASAVAGFTAAAAVGGAPVVPVVPNVPVAQVPAAPRLAVAKSAPARARVLQRVRYRIVVRNTGSVAARNVVLRDRLPGGMSLVRSSVRGTLANGTFTVRLGTIRAGRARVVNVWLRANANVRGARTNVATVSATRARPVRDSARTLFQQLPRRIQPAVTG
jgi:uncharacterized repeat protein (TIGR01451 family)